MTIPKKCHVICDLKLREISSVDRPAQVGAVSVLMKRGKGEAEVSTTDIRKNAAAVATGGDPAFTVTEFEDAMFDRAVELGRLLGCTPEQALAKGLSSDPAMRDFAHASEVARASAYAIEVHKRHAAAAA
jgi:hypothetical protein